MYGRGHSKPILPPTPQMLSSARDHTRIGPLSVYTNVAMIEAANHSSDSNHWRSLYKPMELIDCN